MVKKNSLEKEISKDLKDPAVATLVLLAILTPCWMILEKTHAVFMTLLLTYIYYESFLGRKQRKKKKD